MDDIELSIITNGYIKNNQIWRKWTVSQMLRHGSTLSDYNKYFVVGKPYIYEWTTARDELKTISKLSSKIEKQQRLHFFNSSVIESMADHYKINMAADKNSSLLCDAVIKAARNAKKHNKHEMIELIKTLNKFISYAKFPRNISKSASWKNAFIGAGSYYTIDYLIKFHECTMIYNDIKCDMTESFQKLNDYADEYKHNYNRLYDIMRNFISYNHFELISESET